LPAPVISGFVTYIGNATGMNVWEGEVPRQDQLGNAVVLPIFDVEMTEAGLTPEWSFEGAYCDRGPLFITIWDTTRQSVEAKLQQVETLLAKKSNWDQIPLGLSPVGEPYKVIECVRMAWTCLEEKGVRAPDSSLLYRGELHYDIGVSGAVLED
jgi:hypothetical protein